MSFEQTFAVGYFISFMEFWFVNPLYRMPPTACLLLQPVSHLPTHMLHFLRSSLLFPIINLDTTLRFGIPCCCSNAIVMVIVRGYCCFSFHALRPFHLYTSQLSTILSCFGILCCRITQCFVTCVFIYVLFIAVKESWITRHQVVTLHRS